MSLAYRSHAGAEIADVIDDFARLRIAVFRDWPYLYDGDLDYERDYLQSYARGDAILVSACHEGRMVGAATGMPLADHADGFAEPLTAFTRAIKDVFYCAESVLLSEFRGRGAGHVFFDRREAHAKALGHSHSTFCAVSRPDDHPMRPADYRPLDPFWRARGYAPIPGVMANFSWRDVGQTAETRKSLQFWIKTL